MKKLRKMVSVILCVVISCMCMVTPVCATESVESEDNPAAAYSIKNYGIQQIQMFPAVLDENDNLVALYDPAVSQVYVNGNFLVNLTVDSATKAIYQQNNCNYWVFRILYCSDSNVSFIDVDIDDIVVSREYSKESSVVAFYIPGTYGDYFTYGLTYHYNDNSTVVSGGHVNK